MKSSLGKVIAFSRAAADFQAQLILMLVYFTVLVPFGVIARFQGRAGAKASAESHWTSRAEFAARLESLRRQF